MSSCQSPCGSVTGRVPLPLSLSLSLSVVRRRQLTGRGRCAEDPQRSDTRKRHTRGHEASLSLLPNPTSQSRISPDATSPLTSRRGPGGHERSRAAPVAVGVARRAGRWSRFLARPAKRERERERLFTSHGSRKIRRIITRRRAARRRRLALSSARVRTSLSRAAAGGGSSSRDATKDEAVEGAMMLHHGGAES